MRVAGLAIFFASFAAAEVTYTREVSRILHERCGACHRPGDIGPMSLLSYENAVDYAPDMERVVEAGLMPPWKPTESHGKFKGAFALKPEEKLDLLTWIRNGTPYGDEADLREFEAREGEWVLGQPDLVLKMPEPFTPTRGKDIYRCFVLPTNLEADRFVKAIDVLPGNRQMVHHVIVYLDNSGTAEALDAQDEAPGYDCYGGPGFEIGEGNLASLLLNGFTLGGWAPGARPERLPEGIGMRLGKDTRIVLQVHYYTNVRAGEDQTALGLYFNGESVRKQLFYIPVVQPRLLIPAGEPNHTVEAQFPVFPLLEMQVINVFPHMHLIGTKIEVEKQRGSSRESLIRIDQWDFNWQGAYTFEEPVRMPAFSQVNLRCTYDNSVNNPRNPNNPLKPVRWGEGTEDEMCLAFLGVIFERF